MLLEIRVSFLFVLIGPEYFLFEPKYLLEQERAGFDENSSFIDVGSGLGKPNFHVAQVSFCFSCLGLLMFLLLFSCIRCLKSREKCRYLGKT